MLALEQLAVAYGPHTVVKEISFALAQGQIGCLVGPSGCGKTTLLRAIAGLIQPSAGTIRFDKQLVSLSSLVLPAHKRKIGYVPQEGALFPHLNVAENIAFGIDRSSLTKVQIKQVVKQMLTLTNLTGLESRMPNQLSGGQQTRVALARALAVKPAIILLDEPFSNLDIDLRERLADEMRDILKANNVTALLVTHDQFEAFAIADHIGIMNNGKIVQWDTPYDLYHKPINRYVAEFIGRGVFIQGETQANGAVMIELGQLQLDDGEHIAPGKQIDVLLRADDIQHDDESPMQAEVVRKAFRGADFLYTLKLQSGQEVFAFVPSHHNHAIGEKIGIRLGADHVVTFQDKHQG